MAFLRSLFDDSDKSANPAHAVAFLFSLAIVVWVSWEVYFSRHMPSSLGGAVELLGSSAALNVAHKAEAIIGQFKGTSDPSTPSAQQ
jgi:hypothetical protein